MVTQEVAPIVTIVNPDPMTYNSSKNDVNIKKVGNTDDFAAQTAAGKIIMSFGWDQNSIFKSEKLNPHLIWIPPESVTNALTNATSPADIEDPELPCIAQLQQKYEKKSDALMKSHTRCSFCTVSHCSERRLLNNS